MAQTNNLINTNNSFGTNMKTIKINLVATYMTQGIASYVCANNSGNGINGHVHALSSIFMANLGCLAYSN
jgi:hypothetical protein